MKTELKTVTMEVKEGWLNLLYIVFWIICPVLYVYESNTAYIVVFLDLLLRGVTSGLNVSDDLSVACDERCDVCDECDELFSQQQQLSEPVQLVLDHSDQVLLLLNDSLKVTNSFQIAQVIFPFL